MSSDWMAIQSFHRSQELLSAINELSIHLKLEAAGVADEQQAARGEEGRIKLLDFLRKLEPLIETTEEKEREPVTGADIRMRQLAQRLAERRSKSRGKSPILAKSLSRVIELLESKSPDGRELLLDGLKDLRQLLDEHLETDTRALVGGF